MSSTVDYKFRSPLLYGRHRDVAGYILPFVIHDTIGTYFAWQVVFFARYNPTDETMEIVETGLEQDEGMPCKIVLVVIPILKKLFYLCL